MEGEEMKRKRMVKMLLLRPRCSSRRLLGFQVCGKQWFKQIWDLDLFCENEGEDDVEVEEKADEREQGEDQA